MYEWSLDYWTDDSAFEQYAWGFAQSMEQIAKDCGATFSGEAIWYKGTDYLLGMACNLDFGKVTYSFHVVSHLPPYTCEIWSSESVIQFGDNIFGHCKIVPIVGLSGYLRALVGINNQEVPRHRPGTK